jgi:nitrite reductase/ring-hydroxylating ferredoxin subunit
MKDKEVIRKDNCSYCPHKGMPLHDAVRLNGDIVECPGHAIRWNLKTGKMVSK